jgi:hypothetical protein
VELYWIARPDILKTNQSNHQPGNAKSTLLLATSPTICINPYTCHNFAWFSFFLAVGQWRLSSSASATQLREKNLVMMGKFLWFMVGATTISISNVVFADGGRVAISTAIVGVILVGVRRLLVGL